MTDKELQQVEREARAEILRRLRESIVEGAAPDAFEWASVYSHLTFDDSRSEALSTEAS